MWVTQAVQMCRSSFVFQITHVTHFGSLLVTFFDFFIRLVEIFLTISIISLLEFWYASKMFFIFYFYFLSLSLISFGVPGRVEVSDKKKYLEGMLSSDSDTTGSIEKILTRQIPKHHGRLSTVTRLCHTSHSKVNESQYIWITCVTHSGNRLWSFFTSLDLSRRYLSNNIDGVVVRVSVCL